jgi:thiol-disulfide isomerase/thioredoxin
LQLLQKIRLELYNIRHGGLGMLPLTVVVASVLGWGGNADASLEGVVLDFTAIWCGPCQQMNPIVSRLERNGYPIRKVDVDTNRELCRRFKVDRMPTFLVVVDGVERQRVTGIVSEEQLKRMCASIPRASETAAAAAPASDLVAPIPRAKYGDRPAAGPPVQGDPLAASVRVRVKVGQAENYGSGTVIDSRIGKTTILTCGHVFREWDGRSPIAVDYFIDGRMETVVGSHIGHNIDDDVGLIAVNVDPLLPVCRVSPPDVKILKGTPVVTVGCSGGEKPTKQSLKITATDRYELGADNIEVGGIPAQGRSGGGLFTREGQLIGVCSGADSHYREGLYIGPRTVHNLLARCELTHLSGNGAAESQNAVSRNATDGQSGVDSPEAAASRRTAMTEALVAVRDKTGNARQIGRERAEAQQAATASDDEKLREALEQSGAAEIVCIIRPINQPRAASRVVILNRASPRFVSYLSDEIDAQPAIRETTLTTRAPTDRGTDGLQKVRRPVVSDDAAAQSDKDPLRPVAPQAYRRKR